MLKFRKIFPSIAKKELIVRRFSIRELQNLREKFGGECGEDHLYPAEYFQIIDLTEQSLENLKHYFETALT